MATARLDGDGAVGEIGVGVSTVKVEREGLHVRSYRDESGMHRGAVRWQSVNDVSGAFILNSKIGRTTDLFTSTQGHALLQETPRTPNVYYDILSVLGRFNDISLGRQCSASLSFFVLGNVAILGDVVGMERTSNTCTA